MTEATPPARIEKMLEQRCFSLLLALIALLALTPFLAGTASGRKVIGILNLIILVAAVVSVRQSRMSFMIACLLGFPVLVFQFVALGSATQAHFVLSWAFGAAFYAYTITHLLQYVLRRDEMTADKLYGAVAAYIMIAIFWAFLFGVLQYLFPGAFAYQGTPKVLGMEELIFYSFTVLTTAGFGDITPLLIESRFPTILEAVMGVMYVAILIARLTGVYPIVEPGTGRRGKTNNVKR